MGFRESTAHTSFIPCTTSVGSGSPYSRPLIPTLVAKRLASASGERFCLLTWRASPTVPTRTRWPEDLGRDRGRLEGADSVASVCKEGDRQLCGPAAQPPRRGNPHLRVAEAEVVTESMGALLDLLEKSVPKGGPRRVPAPLRWPVPEHALQHHPDGARPWQHRRVSERARTSSLTAGKWRLWHTHQRVHSRVLCIAVQWLNGTREVLCG